LAAANVHTAYGMTAGAALRGAPPAAKEETKAAAGNTSDTVAAAMDMVASIGASLHSSSPLPAASANAPKTVPAPGKRARLDVGFGDFEKDVVAEVSRCVHGQLKSSEWTEAVRSKLVANVGSMLHAAFAEELKPMKQSIGKTWMALPEDQQKDGFVEQLKSSFADTFSTTVQRVGQHANTSLARLATVTSGKKATEAQLLVDGVNALNSSLLADHCYDEPKGFAAKQAAKQKKEAEAAKKKMAALQLDELEADPAGQFCVKSLLHGFVHRLDDSQNLISMTMRFDARAMAMVQQGKKQRDAEAAKGPGKF